MSTIKERIRMFCERKNIPIAHFENSCGVSNGYVNGIRKSISGDKLERIIKAFPDLRKEWLMSDDGYMLTTDTPEVVEREYQRGVRDRLIVFVSTYLEISLQEFEQKCALPTDFMIKKGNIRKDILDRICNIYPNLNIKWLEYGIGLMLKDEFVTIYERLKYQFKKHKLDFGQWETKVLELSAGTLSRAKNNLSEARCALIEHNLPPEVDKEWIMAGRRKYSKSNASEPSVPYVVSVYDSQRETINVSDDADCKIEQPEVHEIEEGTKAIVIPINLSRNPKMKFSELSKKKVEVGQMMQKFTFWYQVQTEQLESFMIQQGDWLMLAPMDISEVIDGEIYMENSDRFGCMVRAFKWVDETHCKLIELDEPYDWLETTIDDLHDILAIVGIYKNVTSLMPFTQTQLGKVLHQKDKMISDAMNYNKAMFEELRKSGQRTDLLIDALINKLK